MRAFPHARVSEFDELFAYSPLLGGESVIDIPSGGGYIAHRFGGRARVTSLEIASGFNPAMPLVDPDMLATFTGYDHAVCLAALHHFEDPFNFLVRLRATLKPNGTIHLADVPSGSPLCNFLDDFVGRYNTTGHKGRYLSADPALYASLGNVVRCEEAPCPWHFASKTDMLAFCSALFGLVDCPLDDLRTALHDFVGYREDDFGVHLNWRLMYIDIVNR